MAVDPKTLFDAAVEAVDRAARCFVAESDDIDPEFWESLYGPYGPGESDFGMLPWGMEDYDYGDC